MSEHRNGRQRRHRRASKSKHNAEHDYTSGDDDANYGSATKAQHYQENHRVPITPSPKYKERQRVTNNYGYDTNSGGVTKYESSINEQFYEESNTAAPLTMSPLYEEHKSILANQHEEAYSEQLMHEREAEILDINRKVHTVNEIYADLANIIGEQQELIDNIDNTIEGAHADVIGGKEQIEDARLYAENPIFRDPFGDNLSTPAKGDEDRATRSPKRKKRKGKKKKRPTGTPEEGVQCLPPLESLQGDFKMAVNDIKSFGTKLFGACAAPEVGDVTEYTLR
mmetsp:Transcript_37412/g.44641  ORF Transcript_37412/g.44641 Transcript_37412/m.44641 type:complete len:282 (+) Transcript_37412:119-964(+)